MATATDEHLGEVRRRIDRLEVKAQLGSADAKSRMQRYIEPLRKFGASHGEAFGPSEFVGWQTAFDGLNAPGACNYWKSHYLADLDDAAITAILEHAQRLPSPHCEIFLAHMEGAVRKVSNFDTAYPHRDAPFVLNIHSRWEAPGDSTACMRGPGAFSTPLVNHLRALFMSTSLTRREKTASAPLIRGARSNAWRNSSSATILITFSVSTRMSRLPPTNARRRHIWRTGVSVARKSAGTYEGG